MKSHGSVGAKVRKWRSEGRGEADDYASKQRLCAVNIIHG